MGSEKSLAQELTIQKGLPPSLSMAIATATKKFYPIIITRESVPPEIKRRYAKIIFIDVMQGLQVNPHMPPYYLKAMVQFVEKERLKGLGDDVIKNRLAWMHWNENAVEELFKQADKGIDKKYDRIYQYIERERSKGLNEALIKKGMVQAGWQDPLLSTGIAKAEEREAKACVDIITLAKGLLKQGTPIDKVRARLKEDGWSNYHIEKYIPQALKK